MRIDIHVFLESDPVSKALLLEILGRVKSIETKENTEMALIDDLQAEVATNTSVEQSAVQLLQNLKAQLDAAGTDPVKLQAIKDALTTNDQALAAAVAANTPAP